MKQHRNFQDSYRVLTFLGILKGCNIHFEHNQDYQFE